MPEENMKSILNALNIYFETIPNRLLKYRWLVWLILIAVTVFLSFGVVRTKFDMTLEGWFADDDPIKMALDAFKEDFGSDDGVYIVYKPNDGDVFSEKSLKAVQSIRYDLLNFRDRLKAGEQSMLDHIIKINTLVNASILTVKEDSLISSQLVGKDIPTSAEALDGIRETATSQKTFPLLYFSKDYQYGGIFIETDFGTIPLESSTNTGEIDSDEFEEDFEEEIEISMAVDIDATEEKKKYKPTEMNEYLDLMKEIYDILHKPEYADHLKYYPVGNAPMMDFSMEIIAEMGPMYSGMLLIMIMLFWVLFRSFSAVLWPITIVVLSSVWTVGITGWLGVTITTMLMLTIMLILAVGTADTIHLLSGYVLARSNGFNHQEALAFAFKKAALACLLTTVTTMIGMLGLTFTSIAHVKTFGFMSSGGVGLAFILSIFFLPVMLDLWSPMQKKDHKKDTRFKKIGQVFGKRIPNFSIRLQSALNRVMPMVQKSPIGFSLFFLAVFGICVYGATQVKVDSNIIEQFKAGTKIRKTYEVVDAHMMGTQVMEIYMDMGSENALQDPKVLKTIERLQQTITTKYKYLVVRSASLSDVVKDAYQVLNEGREEMYRIPDKEKVLSQTLFLFNSANPEDRRKLVSDNYQKSHISVQLHNTGSFEYIEMFKKMRQDIDAAFNPLKKDYPEMKITITGGLALIMELSDYIAWSQIKSLGIVIGVISILLIFIFGSYRAGLISIIPNLIPATLTFGLLGLLDIPLDSDTMIIAPVIIGIAVDDTIHFITHYRNEVLIDGNITRALVETIKEVGQAITFTSLILGLGFGIMAFSSHVGTSNMGRFGTLAIFVALFCDLFMLPAMILIFKPKFIKKGSPVVSGTN
jgi:uncharacterized protein